jgi:2'-5' RNA ligase
LEKYLLSLDKYPLKAETRPFHPHITIANRDHEKDFQEAFNHFKKIAYKQTYPAGEISLLKHEGGEWRVINRFTFRQN